MAGMVKQVVEGVESRIAPVSTSSFNDGCWLLSEMELVPFWMQISQRVNSAPDADQSNTLFFRA